jgi:hypothetical protein
MRKFSIDQNRLRTVLGENARRRREYLDRHNLISRVANQVHDMEAKHSRAGYTERDPHLEARRHELARLTEDHDILTAELNHGKIIAHACAEYAGVQPE